MLQHRDDHELVEDDAGAAFDAERRVRSVEVSPGRWLSAALGVVLGVFGVVALSRAGVDSTLAEPVVDVGGVGHSALIGIVELVAGVLLLLSSADESSRPLGGLVGALLVIAGVLGASAGAELRADLGVTRESGWLLGVMGVIALAATLMGRSVRTERRTVIR